MFAGKVGYFTNKDKRFTINRWVGLSSSPSADGVEQEVSEICIDKGVNSEALNTPS